MVLAGVLALPAVAPAQLPGGVQVPGGGLSKDALLGQAKQVVEDLTSMKSSGKLGPDQAKQVDQLMPKARSLTTELAKPQIDAAKLPQLAAEVGELQKQVGALKAVLR
jgi:hypothetical protein